MFRLWLWHWKPSLLSKKSSDESALVAADLTEAMCQKVLYVDSGDVYFASYIAYRFACSVDFFP